MRMDCNCDNEAAFMKHARFFFLLQLDLIACTCVLMLSFSLSLSLYIYLDLLLSLYLFPSIHFSFFPLCVFLFSWDVVHVLPLLCACPLTWPPSPILTPPPSSLPVTAGWNTGKYPAQTNFAQSMGHQGSANQENWGYDCRPTGAVRVFVLFYLFGASRSVVSF